MSPRPSVLLVVVPLVVALAAAPVAAQASESSVLKLIKAEAKLTLKQLKLELATALEGLEAGFDAAEAATDDAAFDDPDAQALLAALSTFQQAVRTARDAADAELADDVAQGLDLLANGVPLQGLYPKGLYAGNDGLLDDTLAAIDKQLVKHYAKAAKRAHKAIKAFDAAGFGLTVQLRPPRRGLFPTPSEDSTATATRVATDLEVLLGVSAAGAGGDGRILAAGVSDPVFGDVEIVATGLDAALAPKAFSAQVAPASNGAWALLLGSAGDLLPEGNWFIELDLDPGLDLGAGSVGVP